MKKYLPLTVFVASLAVSACNGEGGDGASDGSIESLEDLVGVYDASVERTGGIIDEIYRAVTSDGYDIEYNYLGDAWDNVLNCYEKSTLDVITHVSGNTFYSDDLEANFLATRSGSTYTFSDGDGYSESFERTNILISDLEAALCDNV